MIKYGFTITVLLFSLGLCWANLQELTDLKVEDTCFGSKQVKVPSTLNDKFADLLTIVQGRVDSYSPKNHKSVLVDNGFSKENPTMGELTNYTLRWHSTFLDQFNYRLISKNEMYPENENVIKYLLKEMATLPLDFVGRFENPLEFVLIIFFPRENFRAIFKPQRTKHKELAHPNHFYFDDFNRHNAEIAAYHLDRILGFRRAAPQVGRLVNLLQEIYELADDDLLNLFYTSPGGNTCVTGRCEIYCDTNHPVCGSPDIIEGSFQASLPQNESASRDLYRHPWARSYDPKRQAIWEVDPNYCETIRKSPIFSSGRRLLDIVDMAVIDFLIGNMHRKDYEMFKIFGPDSFIINTGFGRGFNRPYHDELSILAPLKQCCTIRASTVKTLLRFQNGSKKLSAALREAMSSDPLSPLLWEPHLEALDRRVPIILETVRNCLKN